MSNLRYQLPLPQPRFIYVTPIFMSASCAYIRLSTKLSQQQQTSPQKLFLQQADFRDAGVNGNMALDAKNLVS